jgi:ABC-type amino acid transport substrate-binding protein
MKKGCGEQMNKLPTLDSGRTLVVGLDDAPPAPMQISSAEDDDFRGYEVDLLLEISRRTGVPLRYRRSLWSVILGELISGALDIICSAATVTEERQKLVDFCTPHLALALAVVRRQQDTRGLDLRNSRIGVRRGTTAEVYVNAEQLPASIRLSESNNELYLALRNGEIDAVIDDSPIAAYFARIVPGLRMAGVVPGTDAVYAIMIRKGNHPLRYALNAVLSDMESDGTLQRFQEQWLGNNPGPHQASP